MIREPPRLLPLAAGVAVAEVVGAESRAIEWPNDVLVDGRKVAGILVEGRPQEGWAVVGIGLNVALRVADFPPELRETAGHAGARAERDRADAGGAARALERWLGAGADAVLEAVRARDALLGRAVRWGGGGDGRRHRRRRPAGGARPTAGEVALDAGEVHLLARARRSA